MALKNPSTALFYFFRGSTAQGSTSDGVYRGQYTTHLLQFSTTGTTAQAFIVYASNDGTIWSPIRDQGDCDSTYAGYTGTNATGVISLQGCYPYLQGVAGTASADPFTASIFSTGTSIET